MKKLLFILLCLISPLIAKAQETVSTGTCALCKQPIGPALIETPQTKATRAKALTDWNPTYTIDFLAAFDPRGAAWAINKCGTIEAYAEHVVENMNFVMRNSELDGKFRLVGTFVTDSNVPQIATGVSYCMNNLALRAEAARLEADICLIFADVQDPLQSESGNAFYMPRPGDAFGCIEVKSGYETMTAIHEAGHIMGCAHARDVDTSNPHPYNAGAMRWIDGQQYSTVMGYHGALLPHFSSPNYIYKGTAMGSESEDNCRRITERLPEIVHLGDAMHEFVVSENPKYVSPAQERITLNVHTYTSFNVSTFDAWIHIEGSPSIIPDVEYDATITFRVDENYSASSPREGHITLTPWDDNYRPLNIVVRQLCPNGFFVDPANITVNNAAQTVSLAITATANTFNVVIPEDESTEWLTIPNQVRSGNGSRTVPLQLAANTTGKTRSCNVIVFRSNPTEPSAIKVSIVQSGDGEIGGGDGGDNGDGGEEGGEEGGGDDAPVLYTISPAKFPNLYFTTSIVADNSYTTFSLSSTPEKFIITPAKGGYTIVSANGTKVGISNIAKWDFADAEAVWDISNIEGLETTILQPYNKIGFGADEYADGKGVFTNKGLSHTWIVKPWSDNTTDTTHLPDITGDGVYSNEDFQALCEMILGIVSTSNNPKKYYFKEADVNNDDRITISDLTQLISLLMKSAKGVR